MSNKIKKSLFFKSVSLFLILSFSFYNVSFASIAKDDMAAAKISLDASPLMVEDIGIAIDCGTIKSLHQASGNKVIIHIQDAHCNYEAQQNINRILEQLSSECGVNMISVEGAEGIVDTSWFRAFPDAEIRKEVATYFMKKGEITGAEFFSIISDDFTGTIFGAEDREAYIKNLKAFTTTYPYKPMIENFFQDTLTIANRLKSIIYSKKLKELDLKIRAFDSKEIELSAFAAYLNKCISKNKINLTDYPDFKKLVDTLGYEAKIDFDIVDQERSEYIDSLSKKLSKEDMTELVTYSIKFKKGHIKAVEFYSYLRDIAREQNIPMLQKYPNLFYYYIYTKLYDGIDNEKLFKEINEIETRLKDKLFQDETQRKLDKYAETLDMYVNLVNIELTNDDYTLFEKYTSEFSVEDIIEFLGGLCARYNLNYVIDTVPAQISENIPNMVDFYEIAMKRDKALVDNTLAQMDKEKKNVSVLIAGGFHTRGMKNLLEKQGVSYVVVMPKITKDVETPYIKVLTNQRTSLEDILTESAMPVPSPAVPMSQDQNTAAAKSKMLGAFLRGASVSDLFTEKGLKKLTKLSNEFGSVTGESGDNYLSRVKELFDLTEDMCIGSWIQKKHDAINEQYKQNPDEAKKRWNRYLDDDEYWNTLQTVFLGEEGRDVKERLKKRKEGLLKERLEAFGEEQKTINEAIQAIENDENKFNKLLKVLTPILVEELARIREVELKKRNSPGRKNATGRLLTDEENPTVNGIIEERFSLTYVKFARPSMEFVSLGNIREGLKFVVHDNLADAFIANGIDVGIHAGRGGYAAKRGRKGYLQIHIDRDVYESLTDKERIKIANHELAHLDIANEYGKTFEAWIKWKVKHKSSGDDKEEEKFVNSLRKFRINNTILSKIDGIIQQKKARVDNIKRWSESLRKGERKSTFSVQSWLDARHQAVTDNEWSEYLDNSILWGVLRITYMDDLRKKINMISIAEVEDIKQEFEEYREQQMAMNVSTPLVSENVARAELIENMIKNAMTDELGTMLAEMDRGGMLTPEFVTKVLDDLNRSKPNSRVRTEMVSFCNMITLNYGDKTTKDIAEKEKDMLIAGNLGHTIDPDIYRSNSVRAVADLEMTNPIVRAAGAAYVKTLVQLRNKEKAEDVTIAIGRESRVTGARIVAAFTEGCRDAGATVIDATNGGKLITSTPIMYFASRYLADGKLDGIIETTASHLGRKKIGDEEMEMNGLKPTTGPVNFTPNEMQIWLENTHDAIDRGTRGVALRGKVEKTSILEPYYVLLTAALQGSKEWKGYVNDVYAGKMTLRAAIEAIQEDKTANYKRYANSQPLAGVNLAADSAFGSMGPIMASILKRLGAECVDIGGIADFRYNKTGASNPNVPENLDNLAKKVKEIKALFGIGTDNDGDRLCIATSNPDKTKGRLRGDDISCLMVESIIDEAKKEQGVDKPVIVMNLLCSDRLKKTIEYYGGTAVESGVGFNIVKESMMNNDAVQGVEISSHIMFKENFNADDAFFAVIKLLGVVKKEISKYEERGEPVPDDILGTMLEELNKKLGIEEDYHSGEWRTEMVSNQARVVVADAIGEHYKEMVKSNPDKYKMRNELDGIKVDFYRDGEQVGFLVVRTSDTSPQMVVGINSTISESDFNMIKNDYFAQMKKHKDYIAWDSPKLEPATYPKQAKAFVFDGVSLPVDDEIVTKVNPEDRVALAKSSGIYGKRDPKLEGRLVRFINAIKEKTINLVKAISHVSLKPWGVIRNMDNSGPGEHWIGAEQGAESSKVLTADGEVSLAAMMPYAAEEILGEGVVYYHGAKMPLVKILTPEKWLSIQVHPDKDESWHIVTSGTIILGFSEWSSEKYPDTEKRLGNYRSRLKEYYDVRDKLIDELKKATSAEHVSASTDFKSLAMEHGFIAAILQLDELWDEVDRFHNKVRVEAGQVISIPRGTLHALGPNVTVIEPQVPGQTYRVADVEPILRDMHTEAALETIIPEYIAQPVAPMAAVGADNVRRWSGGFENKGLEVHTISLKKGEQYVIEDVTSFHTLLMARGKARVIVERFSSSGEVVGGASASIPSSQEVVRGTKHPLIVFGNADKITIIADEDAEIIDTFSPVPVESYEVDVTMEDYEEGKAVPVIDGTNVPEYTKRVVVSDYQTGVGVFDQLRIVASKPIPIGKDVKPGFMPRDRKHQVVVREGSVMLEITRQDGTHVREILEKGEFFNFDTKEYVDYTITREGLNPALVDFHYANDRDEENVYLTQHMVRKHIEEIRNKDIDLILPEEMFVRGGRNTLGSAGWEEEQLRKHVSERIRITTYSAHMGLAEAAKRTIRKGAVAILAATQSSIEGADRGDAQIRKFLEGEDGPRVMAIPNIQDAEELAEGRGWFFNREIAGTALLLATVTSEQIAAPRNESNAAADLKQLIEQFTGRPIPDKAYLYGMLSYYEINALPGEIMEMIKSNLPINMRDDPFAWLHFLVDKLLISMPIKPFNATAQLQQRRKVMWSV